MFSFSSPVPFLSNLCAFTFLSVDADVLGNTIDAPACVSLPASARISCHLKKNTKNIQKIIQKISFLGQSFLQVLMNIFLNPYKFYVFNIS